MTDTMYYRSLAMTGKGFDCYVAEMGFQQAKLEVFDNYRQYIKQAAQGTLPAEKDLLLNPAIPEPVRFGDFRARFSEVMQGNIHKTGDEIAEHFAGFNLNLPVFGDVKHQKNGWSWLILDGQKPIKAKRNLDKW